MQFQKGEVHNPRGPPQGSYGGRRLALANLDKLLAREENQTGRAAATAKSSKKAAAHRKVSSSVVSAVCRTRQQPIRLHGAKCQEVAEACAPPENR